MAAEHREEVERALQSPPPAVPAAEEVGGFATPVPGGPVPVPYPNLAVAGTVRLPAGTRIRDLLARP